MTDIFKHAREFPDNFTPSMMFSHLAGLLNKDERRDQGSWQNIALAIAMRERQAGIREALMAMAERDIVIYTAGPDSIQWHERETENEGTGIDPLIKYLGLGGEDGGNG